MLRRQSGFTLVEIAIVLVIIGLLLGGVLKGQELINSAKVKNLANDFRTIPTFVYAYQDKFRALPGDDRAASDHVGAGTPNGDGDGRIEGNWNAEPAGGACPSESCNFWLHVRRANLAAGTTVIGADFIPRNAEGGDIGVTGVSPFTGAGGWAGNFFVCSTNIQGRFVRQLDLAMDDGITNTGNVRVICQGVCASTEAFPAALTTNDDATLYTVCSSY
ncbi:prepilin-type N-terminal cleavage/methylation domain-containing protein [Propionivibrio soli]|uniref:prepilin-type N-terminal cleavage/methylation domain-containing protein n=1 Tax=Propionivibrio soli TaxID=2976531 RepID=UPI0021E7EE84|nr:prepilin-type N-terminal cleavage/methylation domain-containing protein [Propionivibrio soli]